MEEEKKNQVEESNAAKRLRLLGEDMTDEIHNEEAAVAPKSKLAEFWYRNRVAVLIAAFFIVLVGVLLIQAATKPDCDLTMMICTENYLAGTAEERAFYDAIRKEMGNDEAEIRANVLVYDPDAEGALAEQANVQAYNNFNSQLMSGNFTVLVVSPEIYAKLTERDTCPLATLEGALGAKPEKARDEYAVRLYDTALYRDHPNAVKAFPNDTLVCVLLKLQPTDEKEYARSIDALRLMIG